jgi:hypothetical protein
MQKVLDARKKTRFFFRCRSSLVGLYYYSAVSTASINTDKSVPSWSFVGSAGYIISPNSPRGTATSKALSSACRATSVGNIPEILVSPAKSACPRW